MGKNGSRKCGAPSVGALAEHFAKKLSLGGDGDDPVPDFQPVVRSKLSTFRISPKRVRKVLDSLNPNKSANEKTENFSTMDEQHRDNNPGSSEASKRPLSASAQNESQKEHAPEGEHPVFTS